ncbi:lipopolysaccharide transport periplasmic protein LptA [Pseudolysobacter antarcticus]|uniref:Lipopolysaccharide export system protein LptA n=1 Tax=Pseudolysobacter antarcticus TaxID=2511995 RepID=A0A411HGN1_9GAMM|nr:lipopolysaccharide transport periplasmic protein LptA [Pseudolysobacter antarcticus]QBB69649.1 lipopolysaccharide transport periplasmic protein LptA [Pseudolysobacter antarcticus]
MAQCYPANNRKTRSGLLSKYRIGVVLLALFLTSLAPVAFALKSDNDQPMDVTAGTSRIEGDKEVSSKKTIYLHGNVLMVQGTIKLHGDDATIYMDKEVAPAKGAAPSDKSKVKHLILTGKLAHMEQMQDDNGGLMTGDAEKLDYKVDTHLVEMTGNVTVVQQKQGTFHGEHMIYNTLTGEMVSGDESATSRVHIILQPKEEKTPAATQPGTTPTTTPAKKNKAKTAPLSPPAKPAAETTTTTDGH